MRIDAIAVDTLEVLIYGAVALSSRDILVTLKRHYKAKQKAIYISKKEKKTTNEEHGAEEG